MSSGVAHKVKVAGSLQAVQKFTHLPLMAGDLGFLQFLNTAALASPHGLAEAVSLTTACPS
jgi:hypothetical protein